MAEDHGAPEAEQLPRVWTRGRREIESRQRVSGAKSPLLDSAELHADRVDDLATLIVETGCYPASLVNLLVWLIFYRKGCWFEADSNTMLQ